MTTSTALDAEEQAAQASPVRREDLVLEELDGEAILYDPRYGAVHRFSAVTLFVWDLCDGLHTMTDIVQRLTQLCQVDSDEALNSVQRVIAEFSTLDLIQGAPVEPMKTTTVPWWTKASSEPVASIVHSTVGPPEKLRLSRRKLLRGGVSKLVFVAPVISTFFATGAYASGVGSADCKPFNFSCIVNTDCCDEANHKCDTDNKCCIKINSSGCVTDEDCCIGDMCIAGTCM